MDDIHDIFTLSGIHVTEQLIGEAIYELESFLLPRVAKQTVSKNNNKQQQKQNILLCFQVSFMYKCLDSLFNK